MNIYITNPDVMTYNVEIQLIECLANFEGIPHHRITPTHPFFKTYFKGGRPAVLIYGDNGYLGDNIGPDEVVYGFWQFAMFLNKNGYTRL